MTRSSLKDWTRGGEGFVVFTCEACLHAFYFERSFCPECWGESVTAKQASNFGTVKARTLLHRAPSKRLKDHLPYSVMLVDMDDGITVMGRGDPALLIGERARAEFESFGVLETVPSFKPIGEPK